MSKSTLHDLLSLIREIASLHGKKVQCHKHHDGTAHFVTLTLDPFTENESYSGQGSTVEDAEMAAVIESIRKSPLFSTPPRNGIYFCEWPINTLQKLMNWKRDDINFTEDEQDEFGTRVSVVILGKKFSAKAANAYTAGMLAVLNAIRSYVLTDSVHGQFELQDEVTYRAPSFANEYVLKYRDQKELCMVLEITQYPSIKTKNYIAECIVETIRCTAEAWNPQLAKVEACKLVLAELKKFPNSLRQIKSLECILCLTGTASEESEVNPDRDRNDGDWYDAETEICKATPSFKFLKQKGPSHMPTFTTQCRVAQLSVQTESRGKKKDSQRNSAFLMWSLLSEFGIPYYSNVMEQLLLYLKTTTKLQIACPLQERRSVQGIRQIVKYPVKVEVSDRSVKGIYTAQCEVGKYSARGHGRREVESVLIACRALVKKLMPELDEPSDTEGSIAETSVSTVSVEELSLKCFVPLPLQVELQIRERLSSPHMLNRYKTLCPNIIKLELGQQDEDVFRSVWNTWPQLEDLTLSFSTTFTSVNSSLNSIFTGYDDSTCVMFESLYKSIPEIYFNLGYLEDIKICRKHSSISNLTKLKYLTIRIGDSSTMIGYFYKPLTDLLLCSTLRTMKQLVSIKIDGRILKTSRRSREFLCRELSLVDNNSNSEDNFDELHFADIRLSKAASNY